MKRERKTGLSILGLALVTGSALVATVSGSLAWYAYSRNVYFSFVGTTVSKSVLLTVGLIDDDELLTPTDISEYNLVREEVDDHSIVFTKSSNGFSVQAIQQYLRKYKYAVSMLFPISTGARDLNEAGFDLYKSPDFGDVNIDTPASKSDYVRLPFAFKIMDDSGAALADKNIWLTDATVSTSTVKIEQSVRVHVDRSGTQRDFLMKPADRSTTRGSTKVGGLLDLDGDGTYDYNRTSGLEYYYGKKKGTAPLTYSTDPYGIPKDLAELDDVNGVDKVKNPERSTFLAAHNEAAYTVNLDDVEADVAEWETFGTVAPIIQEGGVYSEGDTGLKIATTDSEGHIGYATFSIFIEGWDHSVIDKAVGYSFNLGLKFEVSRN